ncbi:MAG: MMPL family transporter [Planctomycetes bacterium]|nr:MMPL family transporter [Planctomycetota bacterium]
MNIQGATRRRNAWIVIVTIALASIVAAFGVTRLHVAFDVHRVLEQNRSETQKVQSLYDELPWQHPDVLISLTFDHELRVRDVRTAEAVADALRADDRIEWVHSLGSLTLVDSKSLLPTRFFDMLGTDQNADAFEVAQRHSLLRRTFVSADGRSTAIVVRARRGDDADFDRRGLLAWLPSATKRALSGTDDAGAVVRMIGSSVVLTTLEQRLGEGIGRVLLLEILLFLVLLPLLFRTVRGSVLPLGVVLVSVLLNFGWMGWFDYPLTIIDVAIPGLVVIIGLCDAIHLQQCFEERYATSDIRTSVLDMLHRVGRACFYTSFTTAIGFVSLVVTNHDTVSTFGLKAAVSVLVTFVVVLTLLPALLLVSRLGRPRPLEHVRWDWLGYGRPKTILAVTILASVFAAIGISRVVVDSHLLEELPPSDPVAQDFAWYENHFSGIIDVEARVHGRLDDPDVFRRLEQFQERMLDEAGVTRVESITLFAREAIGNPSGALSDAQIQMAFGRLRLARTRLPTHLWSEDFETARVVFKTKDVGSARTSEFRQDIRKHAAEVMNVDPSSRALEAAASSAIVRDGRTTLPGLTIAPAGYVLMATSSTQLVIRVISQSLGMSLIVITVFLGLLFRSVRLAALALITNVLPLAFALGASGFLGMDLTIGSALIYCLGLGLAVDDTIHVLSRYRYEVRHDPNATPREHVTRALHSTGKALVTTSIVLAVGSLCHIAADFQSLVHVGILLTTVIVVALAADLWLLPLLVEHFAKRAKRA